MDNSSWDLVLQSCWCVGRYYPRRHRAGRVGMKKRRTGRGPIRRSTWTWRESNSRLAQDQPQRLRA